MLKYLVYRHYTPWATYVAIYMIEMLIIARQHNHNITERQERQFSNSKNTGVF